MRRLATILAPLLLLVGCNWPQGWHMPRLASNGSSTTQTLIYVQDDVAAHQQPYVAWIARVWDQHPELIVHTTDTPPPTDYNVIRIVTEDLVYPTWGSTRVSTGSTPHIVDVFMRLDPAVALTFGDQASKDIVYHEFCHALGGGFTPPGDTDIHHLCNRVHHRLVWDEVTRVYHNDPG